MDSSGVGPADNNLQSLFEQLIQKLEQSAGLRRCADATAYLKANDNLECSQVGDTKEEIAPGEARSRMDVEMLLKQLSKSTRQKKKGERCTSIDYGQSIRDSESRPIKPTSGSPDTKLSDTDGETISPGNPQTQLPQAENTRQSDDQEKVKLIDCRVQASSCFQGKAWSFTIRREADGRKDVIQSLGDWFNSEHIQNLTKGYSPSEFHFFDGASHPSLASIKEICRSLRDLLYLEIKGDSHPSGLLLVTGGTDCGKSIITRGLIHEYITGGKDEGDSALGKDLPAGKRNRHLVTYEDPIEKWFFREDDYFGNPQLIKSRRIDYTPREKGKDCTGLKECTRAALRQTPTVLFAGELRVPDDLEEALYFGGTGHLIVATAHAGSLVEAADKILTSAKATNAQERAIHIPKILGIIHLSRMDVSFDVTLGKNCANDRDMSRALPRNFKASMFVPSIYRRCPPGMQSFIADGLSALVPHCPPWNRDQGSGIGNTSRKHGSLGRQYLVRHILDSRGNFSAKEGAVPSVSDKEIWEKCWKDIRDFHKGPRDASERTFDVKPAKSGAGPTHLPLWVQCVQDDLRRG